MVYDETLMFAYFLTIPFSLPSEASQCTGIPKVF